MRLLRLLAAPAVILAALAVVIVVLYPTMPHDPVLSDITPRIAAPGDTVTLHGKYFGDEREGADVYIAGARLVSSSYLDWSDTAITLVIPEKVESGPLFVKTNRGTSSSLLFTNFDDVPALVNDADSGLPRIGEIDPPAGAPGDSVTIRGLNFGFTQGEGVVYFTSPLGDEQPLPVSIGDFGYDSWSDQEIKVHVPDDATSGNIRVVNDRGTSNAVFFEIRGLPGTRAYPDRQGYRIGYSIQVSNVKGEEKNSLDIWMPPVIASYAQRITVHDPRPPATSIESDGLFRYHFEDLTIWDEYEIAQAYSVERFSVETRVNENAVQWEYDDGWRLVEEFTSPDALVPSDSSAVTSLVASVQRGERNPYRKARNVFNYVIRQLEYDETASSRDMAEVINSRKGDSAAYAILFTALARASGVPTRVVSGYVISNDLEAHEHYWAEFYIQGFGWVPVDPALADGLRYGTFPERDNLADYYFGNIDAKRITFSRGIYDVKPIRSDSGFRKLGLNYSLQTIYEESQGISSYQSDWRPLDVIDAW